MNTKGLLTAFGLQAPSWMAGLMLLGIVGLMPIALGQANPPVQPQMPPAQEVNAPHNEASRSLYLPPQSVPPGATRPLDVTAVSPLSSDLEDTPRAQAAPETSEQAVTAPAEEKPLADIYQENRERQSYTSAAYLFKVFGILALLLGGFYLIARYLLPRWLEEGTTEPLIPFGKEKTPPAEKPAPGFSKQTFLQSLLPKRPLGGNPDLRIQVLSKARLGPSKEIHVLQIGNRRLVIGSTPQQMTLLTELATEWEDNTGIESSGSSRQKAETYKKYLTHPLENPLQSSQRGFKPEASAIPDQEEIFILSDYEDQLDRS